jgi:hypothetical protein
MQRQRQRKEFIQKKRQRQRHIKTKTSATNQVSGNIKLYNYIQSKINQLKVYFLLVRHM